MPNPVMGYVAKITSFQQVVGACTVTALYQIEIAVSHKQAVFELKASLKVFLLCLLPVVFVFPVQ